MATPFNPLDRENLADSISRALLKCPRRPLSIIPKFKGPGVYALYYCGKLSQYTPLTQKDAGGETKPIYIGKAMPKGGRMGNFEDASIENNALINRLQIHARKLNSRPSLGKADFEFRYLIVEEAFVGLCENYLINKIKPLWNTSITGFGNNALGIGRGNQGPSLWDTLHPPKDPPAAFLKKLKPLKDILDIIQEYHNGNVPKIYSGETGEGEIAG